MPLARSAYRTRRRNSPAAGANTSPCRAVGRTAQIANRRRFNDLRLAFAGQRLAQVADNLLPQRPVQVISLVLDRGGARFKLLLRVVLDRVEFVLVPFRLLGADRFNEGLVFRGQLGDRLLDGRILCDRFDDRDKCVGIEQDLIRPDGDGGDTGHDAGEDDEHPGDDRAGRVRAVRFLGSGSGVGPWACAAGIRRRRRRHCGRPVLGVGCVYGR